MVIRWASTGAFLLVSLAAGDRAVLAQPVEPPPAAPLLAPPQNAPLPSAVEPQPRPARPPASLAEGAGQFEELPLPDVDTARQEFPLSENPPPGPNSADDLRAPAPWGGPLPNAGDVTGSDRFRDRGERFRAGDNPIVIRLDRLGIVLVFDPRARQTWAGPLGSVGWAGRSAPDRSPPSLFDPPSARQAGPEEERSAVDRPPDLRDRLREEQRQRPRPLRRFFRRRFR